MSFGQFSSKPIPFKFYYNEVNEQTNTEKTPHRVVKTMKKKHAMEAAKDLLVIESGSHLNLIAEKFLGYVFNEKIEMRKGFRFLI